jgi:hypothetical protein
LSKPLWQTCCSSGKLLMALFELGIALPIWERRTKPSWSHGVIEY